MSGLWETFPTYNMIQPMNPAVSESVRGHRYWDNFTGGIVFHSFRDKNSGFLLSGRWVRNVGRMQQCSWLSALVWPTHMQTFRQCRRWTVPSECGRQSRIQGTGIKKVTENLSKSKTARDRIEASASLALPLCIVFGGHSLFAPQQLWCWCPRALLSSPWYLPHSSGFSSSLCTLDLDVVLKQIRVCVCRGEGVTAGEFCKCVLCN